jgi:acetyl esterase
VSDPVTGKYFASMGCVCALATYRLVPEAKYPSGAEDISLALKWAKDHAKDYGGDNTKITAIGQSAGGAHLASAVFSGKLKSVDVPLHGIVLLSAPLWYDLRQERRKANMAAYHNSSLDSDILEKTGVACFRNSNVDDVPSNMLLILGEFDPNEIVDGNFMLVEEYRKRFARIPSLEVLKGHNHISYFYGIGLGDDRLGKRVLEFIAQK